MSTKTAVRSRFLRQLWGVVFPINCLSCGRESDWLCESCLQHLVVTRPELCRICGKAGSAGLCDTHRLATKLDGVISLFAYRQKPIQNLIKAVKYHSLTDGLTFFELHFGRKLERLLPREDWVYQPIPLANDRLKQRGFNQAELLARLVADNREPVGHLLSRLRETQPQVELEKDQRTKNVRGCFALKKGQSIPESVVLFDDVITTGATLKEAAKVLRKAGVKTIWAVTVAHG